jgi:hypothetical protein
MSGSNVCEHGSLKRSCEMCEKNAEIESLQRAILNMCIQIENDPKPHNIENALKVAKEVLRR